MINMRRILPGIMLLLTGVLIYLIDRPPADTYFLAHLPLNPIFYGQYPNVFGFLGDFLPSFLHAIGFILLTAGIVASDKKAYGAICIFWLVINAGFELGQKYSSHVAARVPEWFEGIFILENTSSYFINGTYSNLDMASIIVGAGIAYLVLLYTEEKRGEL